MVDERKSWLRRRVEKALTSGFTLAFWVAVGFAVVALVATLLMIHAEEIAEPAAAPSPTG